MSINLPLVLDAASQPHGLTDALRRRWRFIGSVFVADLAGWSALCERLTTMEALVKANQTHAYIAAMVGDHGGQVVKTSGDNLFAVFGDAVSRGLRRRDHPPPGRRRQHDARLGRHRHG